MMNGEKFQKMIDTLRLNQVDAAEFFDVHPRTIRRYVSDEHPVNGAVEKLGMLMVYLGLLPRDIDKMLASDEARPADNPKQTARERKKLLMEAMRRRKADEFFDDVKVARGAAMAGLSYSDIGQIIGVSKQRVHQLVKGA